MLFENELVRRVTGRGAGKFSNWSRAEPGARS